MFEVERTSIIIEEQGAPLIGAGAHIAKRGEGIVAIHVDLNSKYCEPVMYLHSPDGCPSISIGANENSLHLLEGRDRYDATVIAFTDFPGWRIFATDCGRYTINVCLVKDDFEE